MQELTIGSKEIHKLRYLITLDTKGSRPIFEDNELRQAIDDGCKASAEETEGCAITEYHILPNEIHMVVENAPKYPIQLFVRTIKDIINDLIREEFKELLKKYYGKERDVWKPGYCLVTLGAEEERKVFEMRERWLKEPEKARITPAEIFIGKGEKI